MATRSLSSFTSIVSKSIDVELPLRGSESVPLIGNSLLVRVSSGTSSHFSLVDCFSDMTQIVIDFSSVKHKL